MRRISLIILMVSVFSMSFFPGCGAKQVELGVENVENVEVKKNTSNKGNGEVVELELWTWYSISHHLKQFEAENKDIKVKEKVFTFEECKEEYSIALANGEGPDVLMFDSGFFGQYTVGNVLQNLLEEPCSAEKYKDDFLGWESGLSFDKKQLLSLTISTAPYVTIYRHDIMKENGFPSEPEEFSKFIEKEENIYKIAAKLKEKDMYIFQYPTDFPDIAGSALGFFDDKLNFVRSGDLFAKALDIAMQANEKGWQLGENFWNDRGTKALQDGKLVMFSLPSYAMGTLQNKVPEQKGKWRVAKAPLGITAWGSDSRISINGQSENKEAAWKLVEYLATQKNGNIGGDNVVPGYIPIQKNPRFLSSKASFFGDQNVYPLLLETAEKMVQYKLTPMDEKALEIYRVDVWWTAAQRDINAYDAINRMKNNVEKALEEDREILADME